MNNESAFVRSGHVTPENVTFYKDFGYLICPDMVSPEEIAELKKETVKIFRGERGVIDGMLPVTAGESDADVLKKYVAIHFPHKISQVLKTFLSQKSIVDVLKKVVSPNVKSMQSMLFVKGPGKAGQSWHQDEYYIPTRDQSLVGVWVAIDDANYKNGCLWLIPGSHKHGYIMPRVANSSDEYADVDVIDVSGYPAEKMIPVEVKSGAVVFFHGYLLHSSKRNKTTDTFRTALVNHYMSAESMLPWDQDGKCKLTEDMRDIVMIAGRDPYAHKPVTDLNKPYLRPEVLEIRK